MILSDRRQRRVGRNAPLDAEGTGRVEPRNAIEQLRAKYMHRLPELFDGLIELTKSDSENIRL
jgi:hypothetical protein